MPGTEPVPKWPSIFLGGGAIQPTAAWSSLCERLACAVGTLSRFGDRITLTSTNGLARLGEASQVQGSMPTSFYGAWARDISSWVGGFVAYLAAVGARMSTCGIRADAWALWPWVALSGEVS